MDDKSLQITNPYGSPKDMTRPSGGGLGIVEVETARAVSEAQAMVLMAKKFPRDPVEAMDKILTECQRISLASVAVYSYSKGGTDISGASIRLAEVLARNWQNLDVGVKELSQANGKSEMMSYCVDLENNYRQVKIFAVSHTRHTKKGSYEITDGREQYEMNANYAARRLRACILSVIPGDVIEAAVNQCEQTLKAKADTSPAAMKKMIELFEVAGVTKDQIEKRIQRRIDAITPAQVISLRKIYNSLKDGMSVPADWFEVLDATQSTAQTGAEAAKQALKAKKSKTEAAATATDSPTTTATISPQLAPGPCPPGGSMEGDTPTAEYCNQCPKRDGCVTWPETR